MNKCVASVVFGLLVLVTLLALTAEARPGRGESNSSEGDDSGEKKDKSGGFIPVDISKWCEKFGKLHAAFAGNLDKIPGFGVVEKFGIGGGK